MLAVLDMRIEYNEEQPHSQIENDVQGYIDTKGWNDPNEEGDYVIFFSSSLEDVDMNEGKYVYSISLDYDSAE